MRTIKKDCIVVGFLDESNKIKSGDSFLSSLNQTGVPQCTVTRKGRTTALAIDEKTRVFPDQSDFVISLKNYLETNGYTLQLMGDML